MALRASYVVICPQVLFFWWAEAVDLLFFKFSLVVFLMLYYYFFFITNDRWFCIYYQIIIFYLRYEVKIGKKIFLMSLHSFAGWKTESCRLCFPLIAIVCFKILSWFFAQKLFKPLSNRIMKQKFQILSFKLSTAS